MPTQLLFAASYRCIDGYENLSLIIPMAILGILLIIFVFVVDFNVSNGVIIGLVYYANVASINSATFGFHKIVIFRSFLAWINLDFGIPSCFYHNLNMLDYIAWQFVFPIYLIILVGIIILACNYSVWLSEFLSSSNPVAVLATVVLLSYTKLIRASTDIFRSYQPTYPPNITGPLVWRLDGTIIYGQGLHLILLIISLCVMVVLFPFAIMLALSQFLLKVRCISDRVTKYSRLMLVLNTYHAAFKPNCRFWIGFSLCFRWVFVITNAVSEDVRITNLISGVTGSILLLSVIGAYGGVYRSKILNIIEISFIANIGLLSAVTYHLQLTGQLDDYQIILVHVSASVVFFTFLAITIVKIVKRFYKCFKNRKEKKKMESSEDFSVENSSEHLSSTSYAKVEENTINEPINKIVTSQINVELWRMSRYRDSVLDD